MFHWGEGEGPKWVFHPRGGGGPQVSVSLGDGWVGSQVNVSLRGGGFGFQVNVSLGEEDHSLHV